MPRNTEAAAVAAGWRPHPRNSEQNRAVKWMYPELTLRVWAELDGVHLYALLWYPAINGKTRHEELAKAVWQPSEVTEYKVVEWAERALRRWLVDHDEVPEEPVVDE